MMSQQSPLIDFDLAILSKLGIEHLRPVADSREVRDGDVFLACQGEYTDGRDYIAAAIASGAEFILWDDAEGFIWDSSWEIPNLAVPQLYARAGLVAAYLLDNPSTHLNAIGVTGTNGKTSITQWLAQAFDLLNLPCAIIGTVGNGFLGRLMETTHTTPDAVHIQHLLADFKAQGAKRVAVEVSSHGLDQFRVNGVEFRSAIFTNLTRDHLDYHGDMASYAVVKNRLFYWQSLKSAIINIDDISGIKLIKKLTADVPQLQILGYGFSKQADICIKHFHTAVNGMQVTFATPWGESTVNTRLLGRFNAQNLAATLAALCVEGHPLSSVAAILSQIKPATGRMDCLIEAGKPLVVVDYAHTPDALEKALQTLQEIKPANSKLWCVFGCGGNRDKGKRSLMGKAAVDFADCVVVTSDNPRLEDPIMIIKDILEAVIAPTLVEVNREEAIKAVIKQAGINDIVLIAGKGHELYQDVGGEKSYFSDFDIARSALKVRV